jgi:hypothetical protein
MVRFFRWANKWYTYPTTLFSGRVEGNHPASLTPEAFFTTICKNGGLIVPKSKREGGLDRKKPAGLRTNLTY